MYTRQIVPRGVSLVFLIDSLAHLNAVVQIPSVSKTFTVTDV